MGSAFKPQAAAKKYGRTKEVASVRKMLGEMGMEPRVEHLPSKSNGLGLIPSITKQVFGDVLCLCNSFTSFKVP